MGGGRVLTRCQTKKEDKYEEMSIESGIPDIESETKESDKIEEDLEIENTTRPDVRKGGNSNFGDISYKIYTNEFDEIIKAEDLENFEELSKLRNHRNLYNKREVTPLIEELGEKLVVCVSKDSNGNLLALRSVVLLGDTAWHLNSSVNSKGRNY